MHQKIDISMQLKERTEMLMPKVGRVNLVPTVEILSTCNTNIRESEVPEGLDPRRIRRKDKYGI